MNTKVRIYTHICWCNHVPRITHTVAEVAYITLYIKEVSTSHFFWLQQIVLPSTNKLNFKYSWVITKERRWAEERGISINRRPALALDEIKNKFTIIFLTAIIFSIISNKTHLKN